MPTGLIIGAAVVGAGLSAASAIGGASSAKDAARAQQAMIAEQQKQDQIRQQAMELDAQRKQVENLRQVQRSRSMAVATAGSQGALFGSGLQGGLAQAQGQGNWNALGINQNLQFGEQMFASNAMLNQDKIAYSNAQSDQAMWQGLGSLGGTLMSSASTIGNVFGNVGGARSPINQGAPGGGYYGGGGNIYPGPGRY